MRHVDHVPNQITLLLTVQTPTHRVLHGSANRADVVPVHHASAIALELLHRLRTHSTKILGLTRKLADQLESMLVAAPSSRGDQRFVASEHAVEHLPIELLRQRSVFYSSLLHQHSLNFSPLTRIAVPRLWSDTLEIVRTALDDSTVVAVDVVARVEDDLAAHEAGIGIRLAFGILIIPVILIPVVVENQGSALPRNAMEEIGESV
jgi:hypothetical protein